MNTTRTLLCVVLLLSVGRLVPADATVIEDFCVSWARADGDKLLVGGTMKDRKRGVLCMVDAEGTITRLCEGPLPSTYDDAVLDGDKVFAAGRDLADFRIEAWRDKKRLFGKVINVDDTSVGKARVFAMPDHLLLICELGENPKQAIKPRLLVAELSKEDGTLIKSWTLRDYQRLLWADRDESGDVCFVAANTAGSSEEVYMCNLVACRVGEKPVPEMEFNYHHKVAEGEKPAEFDHTARIDGRFVALAWCSWAYKGLSRFIKADPESGILTTIDLQTDPEAWPQAWFEAEDCLYAWFKTSGENSESRIAEVSLDGKVRASSDPTAAVRKALAAQGWEAGHERFEMTKPGTNLAYYVYPEYLYVAPFGDDAVLLYTVRQENTQTSDAVYHTLVLKQWR
jgi:hypothetical protein